MVRAVKTEILNDSRKATRSSAQNVDEAQGTTNDDQPQGNVGERRILRSKYLRFKNRISDERDDIVNSEKFKSMIEEVDNLHQLVQKPREQVSDAEALFDITHTLVTSVKAFNSEGVTPADFVSCLLRDFGQDGGSSSRQNEARSLVRWKDIGQVVSHVFRSAPGCCTMVGPMNTELKHRKVAVHRKRTKPTENSRPEELFQKNKKEKTDTDKNMATIFDILRGKRKARLENLILNRKSFAQTLENLFALSFLIKDGRVVVSVNEAGHHLVSLKNAPTADAILSGEVSYSHFIFRFDFSDWKLMLDSVEVGEELMPHREVEMDKTNNNAQRDSESEGAEEPLPSTPIRKLCRNRGLVMQEQAVVADSPESDDTAAARAAAIRKGKRKLVEF